MIGGEEGKRKRHQNLEVVFAVSSRERVVVEGEERLHGDEENVAEMGVVLQTDALTHPEGDVAEKQDELTAVRRAHHDANALNHDSLGLTRRRLRYGQIAAVHARHIVREFGAGAETRQLQPDRRLLSLRVQRRQVREHVLQTERGEGGLRLRLLQKHRRQREELVVLVQ